MAELLSAAVAENAPIAREARIIHDRYFNFISVLHRSFILEFIAAGYTSSVKFYFFREDSLVTQLALFIFTTKCTHLLRSAEIPPEDNPLPESTDSSPAPVFPHLFCHRVNTQLSWQPDNAFHNMPGCLFTQNVLCKAFVHFYITGRKVL